MEIKGWKVTELRQLYDEQGRPLVGKGATKYEVLEDVLLHGASHIWIWRVRNDEVEILQQKRGAEKATWPNLYAQSAAGHIDLGEDPIAAAIRETKEEIGLTISAEDLQIAGIDRCCLPVEDTGWFENEICWLYTLRLDEEQDFVLAEGEVGTLRWRSVADISADIHDPVEYQKYLPIGQTYYYVIFNSIARQRASAVNKGNTNA